MSRKRQRPQKRISIARGTIMRHNEYGQVRFEDETYRRDLASVTIFGGRRGEFKYKRVVRKKDLTPVRRTHRGDTINEWVAKPVTPWSMNPLAPRTQRYVSKQTGQVIQENVYPENKDAHIIVVRTTKDGRFLSRKIFRNTFAQRAKASEYIRRQMGSDSKIVDE